MITEIRWGLGDLGKHSPNHPELGAVNTGCRHQDPILRMAVYVEALGHICFREMKLRKGQGSALGHRFKSALKLLKCVENNFSLTFVFLFCFVLFFASEHRQKLPNSDGRWAHLAVF